MSSVNLCHTCWVQSVQNPTGLIMWPTLSLGIPSFKSNVSMFDLTIFLNNFFNAFLMRLLFCCYWPLQSCFVTQTCFPHFFLLNLPYPVSLLTSTYLSPYTACTWWWMLKGGIFSAVKNLITAHCLNCMFSQLSISIGTEPELWIAVDSRLHMVGGRYHVTAWNWFYPVFIARIKNMAEEVKLFSLSSVFYPFAD